ncbi:hypothetical protein [Nonomuraea bangladeshensis]
MSDHVRLLCLRHAESENVIAGAAGALPLASLTAKDACKLVRQRHV